MGDDGRADATLVVDAGPPPVLDAGPGPASVDAFVAAFADAACAFIARCSLAQLAVWPGAASCEEYQVEMLRNVWLPIALIAEGRATYDDRVAARCLADLATATCAGGQSAMLRCYADRVVAGVLPAGAACAASVECDRGLYCDDAPGCGNMGTCRPTVSLGAACTAFDECGYGSSYCASGRCQPAPTGTERVGAACMSISDCLGLRCWSGTCHLISDATFGDLGAPCAYDGQFTCRAGLVCSAAIGGTCQEPVLPGGSCSGPFPRVCADGGFCDAGSGTCAPAPTLGETCDTDLRRCASGLACDCVATPGSCVCVALHQLAEACSTPAECWSSVCTDGVCRNPLLCD